MKPFKHIALIAMILAFAVVLLGAYTRLTNAGLGCPDWPGCYGRMILPSQSTAVALAQQTFPMIPIESRKAWTEMAHRYGAGTLAILIVILAGMAWRYRRLGAPKLIPTLLLALVGFQAALGMWTVTLKLLPVVVMGHLLGGLLIFAGLVYLNWTLRAPIKTQQQRLRLWVDIGLIIVFCQIALGGWVSSNYAGLACLGFPRCNGQWLPLLDWHHSFKLSSLVGENYQGGLLDSASRITIQMVHRLGACITALYIGILSVRMIWIRPTPKISYLVSLVLLCLVLQISLGIINVWYWLPLWAAVAHNGMAALLLAALLSLRYGLVSGDAHVNRH